MDAPAESRPERSRIPEFALLWRGLALGALSTVLVLAALKLATRGLPGLVVALAPAAGSILSGWAALIHLTGGEEFDDMPWV